MKNSFRILSLVVLLLCVFTFSVFAEDVVEEVATEGKCGEKLSWTFDESMGTLCISGEGDMQYYSSATNVPWNAWRGDIRSAVVEDGVTSICKYAFINCGHLEDLQLANSVTKIGDSAFSGCSSLKEITIPTKLQSVGKNAFSKCSGIVNVNIQDILAWCSVTFDNEYANPAYYAKSILLNGGSIVYIAVPDGVEKLDHTFMNFTELASVKLPDSVKEIGDFAFYNCKNLISIDLSTNIQSIGASAFYQCFSLTELKLPQSIRNIGEKAFYYCYGIEEIKFSDGLETIGNSAFNRCIKVKKLELPGSLTAIGENAFSGCSALEKVSMHDNIVTIGSGAFSSCPLLRKVENISSPNLNLSGRLVAVSDRLFSGCPLLEEMKLPSGIVSIGASAFSGCAKLKQMTIPASVVSIGSQCFSGCQELTAVYFGEASDPAHKADAKSDAAAGIQLGKIGSGAFTKCGVYPEQVDLNGEIIPEHPRLKTYFNDLKTWCYIDFGDAAANPMNCSRSIYLNNRELTDLTLSGDIDLISAYAFVNAKSIRNVSIPASVKGIGINAFDGCSGISTVKYSGSDDQWKKIDISSGNDRVVKDSVKMGISYAIQNIKTTGGFGGGTVPKSKFRVNFTVENLFSCDNLMVIVVCYDSAGRFVSQSSLLISAGDDAESFNIPVDNRDGRIASYKIYSMNY